MSSINDQSINWQERCEFIKDYFFGPQRLIAHQRAVRLAEDWMGEPINLLRPDTDMPVFLKLNGEEFRNKLRSLIEFVSGKLTSVDAHEMLLALEEETGYRLKLDEVITFKDMVRLQQTVLLALQSIESNR